jgi:hypothetical protein
MSQIGILGAGALLIFLGLGGLLPLLANQRRLYGRLRINESWNPALSVAAGVMRPMPSPPRPSSTSTVTPKARPTVSVEQAPDMDDLSRVSRFGDGEVSAAEELLAQLFTIRMSLSDLVEEIHTLRDVYNLDDYEIVEDIDDADDGLSDIDQDEDPEEAAFPKVAGVVSEAA